MSDTISSAVQSGSGSADRFDRIAVVRTGRILTGLVIAFLAFDAIGKLLRIDEAVKGTRDLGFPTDVVVPLGVLLAIAVALYAVPRTSFLGALLTTAYLGGAVCANVRLELPIASHVLAPVYVAVLLWGGLFLRSAALRELVRSGR